VLGGPRRNQYRGGAPTDRGVRRAAYQRSPHCAVAARAAHRAAHDEIDIGADRVEDRRLQAQDGLLNPRTVNEDRERGVTDY